MLTPMEIHDHQFKKSFRGYSENEVDDFLDRIVSDFERLLRDNERLKNQVANDGKELEKYRVLEKTMNDTLMVAQRTADEVISNAKKTAEEMKESAARECQTIRDQAQLEAKQHIDAALVKRDAIMSDYAKTVREKNAFLVKMRSMLESQLAITEHVVNSLPNVGEAIKAAASEDKPIAPFKPSEAPKPAPTPKPVTPPKHVEKPKPVVERPKPAPPPKPVETPKLVKKPAKVPQLIEDEELNLVDVSTKPVVDNTRTYKPVKEGAK